MDTRIDRIGLDLGLATQAEPLAEAAAELRPDMVRLRFGLDGHVEPGEAFLTEMERVVEAFRSRGMRILALLDSDLTVAPEGMGAFLDRPPGPLARAWTEEMAGNARRLAEAIGERVAAWEILPAPNAGSPYRIAPARWAGLLASLAASLREAQPGARIVSGALRSTDADEGLDYLRAAWRAARAASLWPEDRPPFDELGLQLEVLPEGADSEAALATALRERASRLRAGLAELAGAGAEAPALMVTGLAWDALRLGEERQASHLWTALDSLTAEPAVRMVIWSGLRDLDRSTTAAAGLYRGGSTEEAARRPAWRSFRDFSTYARQISPSPLAEAMAEAAGQVAKSPEVEPQPVEPDVVEPEPVEPEPVEPEPVQPEVAEPDAIEPDVVEPEPEALEMPPAPVEETIAFHIPNAEEVLRGRGYGGPRLAELLEAVRRRYGGHEWLPPGDYQVTLPRSPEDAPLVAEPTRLPALEPVEDAGDAAAELPDLASVAAVAQARERPSDAAGGGPEDEGQDIDRAPVEPVTLPEIEPEPPAPVLTNQQVISALYRAGGGSWALFERSGLSLRELAARRTQPYEGPDPSGLEGLDEEELATVERELASLRSSG